MSEIMLMPELVVPMYFFIAIIAISIWESIWKAIGMWKSARNNNLAWFIVILIFNTLGILPLIYLAFVDQKKKPKKKSKKKNL